MKATTLTVKAFRNLTLITGTKQEKQVRVKYCTVLKGLIKRTINNYPATVFEQVPVFIYSFLHTIFILPLPLLNLW